MKRARDEATGATLSHILDGGGLYVSSEPRYLFCSECDKQGRDPYVSSSREIGFKPTGVK